MTKRIYNNVTKKFYALQQKNTKARRVGQIQGLWARARGKSKK